VVLPRGAQAVTKNSPTRNNNPMNILFVFIKNSFKTFLRFK
jgi:hypothetical protein